MPGCTRNVLRKSNFPNISQGENLQTPIILVCAQTLRVQDSKKNFLREHAPDPPGGLQIHAHTTVAAKEDPKPPPPILLPILQPK